MKIKTTINIIMAIVLMAGAGAIGVAPGTIRLPYSPGEHVVKLIIVNNQDEPARVQISSAGELSISLAEQAIDMAPREEHELSLAVMLESLSPGEHISEISIAQLPNWATDGTGIAASGGVISKIIVEVPYPDKYLVAGMKANDKDIVVDVTSKGTEPIAQARADITITSESGQPVMLTTDTKSVLPGQMRELVARHSLLPGEYSAAAIVDYDGNRTGAWLDFAVRTPNISIMNYSVETKGEISHMVMQLNSNWNSPIELYGVLLAGSEIYTSPTIQVVADKPALLDLYFPAGEKDLELMLHYAGITDSHWITLSAEETPQAAKQAPLLLIPSIILVMIALVIILWRTHERRR